MRSPVGGQDFERVQISRCGGPRWCSMRPNSLGRRSWLRRSQTTPSRGGRANSPLSARVALGSYESDLSAKGASRCGSSKREAGGRESFRYVAPTWVTSRSRVSTWLPADSKEPTTLMGCAPKEPPLPSPPRVGAGTSPGHSLGSGHRGMCLARSTSGGLIKPTRKGGIHPSAGPLGGSPSRGQAGRRRPGLSRSPRSTGTCARGAKTTRTSRVPPTSTTARWRCAGSGLAAGRLHSQLAAIA